MAVTNQSYGWNMYTHSSLILASRQINRYVCIRSDSRSLSTAYRYFTFLYERSKRFCIKTILPINNLRSHILDSPTKTKSLLFETLFAKTKICDSNVTIRVKQNVLGFQIPRKKIYFRVWKTKTNIPRNIYFKFWLNWRLIYL